MSTTTKTGSAFDVFKLRYEMVNDCCNYLSSFLNIKDERVREKVESVLNEGQLWHDPLIQMNSNFAAGESTDSLVKGDVLHPKCREIFAEKAEGDQILCKMDLGKSQLDGLEAATACESYVLPTGTGSGNSLYHLVPIVGHLVKNGSGEGLKALIIYPKETLANGLLNELERFLKRGLGKTPPVSFARYTGQNPDDFGHLRAKDSVLHTYKKILQATGTGVLSKSPLDLPCDPRGAHSVQQVIAK